MSGGTTGMRLELSFSVAVHGADTVSRVVCEPIWAYEADLFSTDLIIGYPYLSGFGLAVDPRAATLVFSTLTPKICHKQSVDVPAEVPRSVCCYLRKDGCGSSEDSPDDSGRPGPFQVAIDPVFHLVAELYLLFWFMSSSLQMCIRQSQVSIDEDIPEVCPIQNVAVMTPGMTPSSLRSGCQVIKFLFLS